MELTTLINSAALCWYATHSPFVTFKTQYSNKLYGTITTQSILAL